MPVDVNVRSALSVLDQNAREIVANQLHTKVDLLANFWQADIVLALLRSGADALVERILGKPILRLPPDPRLSPLPKPRPIPRRPGPRIKYVYPENPRLPTTDAWHRYRLIRRGSLVEDLYRRGVTRRDLRILQRSGYVEVE